MYFPAYVESLRKEVRYLRIHEQQLEAAHKKQKGLNQLQKEEIQKLKKEKRILEKHIEKLKREIEKYGKTQNRYQVAVGRCICFHPARVVSRFRKSFLSSEENSPRKS